MNRDGSQFNVANITTYGSGEELGDGNEDVEKSCDGSTDASGSPELFQKQGNHGIHRVEGHSEPPAELVEAVQDQVMALILGGEVGHF